MRNIFPISNYKILEDRYQDRYVIAFVFPNVIGLRNILKEYFPKARWSTTKKYWWVLDNVGHRHILGMPARQFTGEEMKTRISAVNVSQFNRYLDAMRLKGFSDNTIKTYAVEFAQLLYILKDFSVLTLTPDKLRSYLLYCHTQLKLSENQIHSRLNAIKFYFEQILHQDKFFYEIPRPKKVSSLPKVLSTKEILRLFEQTNNLKHQILLKLCYGLGLRVSELVNIRIEDIDSCRMMVHIRNAKNKKDRYVPLPVVVLEPLRQYYKEYLPREFLFEGQAGGAMAVRTVQAVFKSALAKAKIRKKVGVHGLRHSYATHLLEFGTDLTFIQKLLGHAQISTTEIYAKVSNKVLAKVISPLDRI